VAAGVPAPGWVLLRQARRTAATQFLPTLRIAGLLRRSASANELTLSVTAKETGCETLCRGIVHVRDDSDYQHRPLIFRQDGPDAQDERWRSLQHSIETNPSQLTA
jgi:hypothetical protein